MKTTPAVRRGRDDTLLTRALDDARARACPVGLLLGEIEGYCEHTACSVRYVRITIKEHYPEERVRPPMVCPFCRHTLKLHHVRTARERHASDVEDAYQTAAFDILERRDNGFVNLGPELDELAAAIRDRRWPRRERTHE
jgi:hypothetical protein